MTKCDLIQSVCEVEQVLLGLCPCLEPAGVCTLKEARHKTGSMHAIVAGDGSHKVTFKETAGADIGGVLLIAALIEEPADLVHP